MEDTTNLHDLEEFEDTLSLCDLPIDNHEPYPDYPNSPSNQDLFEFSINPNPELDNFIFCGKIIPQKHEPTNLFNNDKSWYPFPSRSNSLRMLTSNAKSAPSPATGNHPYHSSNSNKHKVLIGLAKVPSEMKLSDIKKRQTQRTPAPMFPVVNSKKLAVSGGGSGCWGMLRPLRLLAKASLGCIPRV